MSRLWTTITAAVLLVTMALLMFLSVKNDSLTMDEQSHLPAGISYVTQLDYRMNPEHPPLLKLIAGWSANLLHPVVPIESSAWENGVNAQWEFGQKLLDANQAKIEQLIFFGRLPMMLLTLLFGGLLFGWARRQWNDRAASITLFLYCLSPTIIAHGRYVTFDLGAGLGFFVGLASFLAFLRQPTWKRAIAAGLLLGLGLLTKFSVLLLLPLLLIVGIGWQLAGQQHDWLDKTGKSFVMLIIAIAVIYLVYTPLLIHYPSAKHLADAKAMTLDFQERGLLNIDLNLLSHSATRPLGHFFLGALLTDHRARYGNTGYFLGMVNNTGNSAYFPYLYLTKQPLPVLAASLLSFISLLVLLLYHAVRRELKWTEWRSFVQRYFVELNFLFAISIYWWLAIRSPLNLGIRHVLPTFPFIFLLIGRALDWWLDAKWSASQLLMRKATILVLGVWLVYETITAYPHYLSYYNQLAGGWENGYLIATDSNYDWGQDLKRLADYTKAHELKDITIDYFGGANPTWYFGSHYTAWTVQQGRPHGWFAVSLTHYQLADGGYGWLSNYQPIQIGSILLYHL